MCEYSNCINTLNSEKVSGLYWDHLRDVISFKISETFQEAINIPSKRKILSIIAGAYDPIGYLQPLVITLKILFQEICKLNIKWDDNIGEFVNKWYEIVKSLLFILRFITCMIFVIQWKNIILMVFPILRIQLILNLFTLRQ